MLNDEDWELFVPEKGSIYPPMYQIKHKGGDWRNGMCGGDEVAQVALTTDPIYRRPKQKETKMPDRTPQQALRDAIDSGAVEAWINGEGIQYISGLGWFPWTDGEPEFLNEEMGWRPKPPEPTKINWQPVVTGKEPEGVVLGTWGATVQSCYCRDGEWYRTVDGASVVVPWSWAPMCKLPEGDK